jgi:2-dehydropantoate 2-reductase
MKIIIIGAGAVGGVIAGYLSHVGQEITLVCKHRQIVETINNHGLRIEGIRDNLITYPQSIIEISQVSEKPDIVLIATKAYHVETVAETILPYLKDDSLVVSLQNGICEDRLAAIVGKNRTIGCVVEWGATLLGPGRMELTSLGRFIIGELNGQITHRLFVLRSILEKVFPVEITDNIYGARFSKLIVNATTSTLGAVTGMQLGELLMTRLARNAFLQIVTEAVNIADQLGIKLEKIANKLSPYDLKLTPEERSQKLAFSLLKKHIIIMLIGFKYRKLKSSSLQSLERKQNTEVEYLNGYLVQKGIECHVPTPFNSRLVDMVKEIEQGKRKIEFENLYRII